MRGIVTYLVGGTMGVLAFAFIAPPVGLVAVDAKPVVKSVEITQFVDRTHKSDRLSQTTAVDKQPALSAPPRIMIGCDPAFSPLSASASANVSGRCIA